MPSRMQRLTRLPGRVARNISLATRLSMVVVLVALVSVVVTAIVGLSRGRDLANVEIEDQLTAVAAARGDLVERYIAGVERAVTGQAVAPRSAVAIGELTESLLEVNAAGTTRADRLEVEAYYDDVVAPTLSEARGRPVSAASLLPVSAAAITLQAHYVVPSDGGSTPPALESWASVHDPLDESFQEFVIRNGIADFYLIEPEQQVVVYSSAKDIDFGTSLESGPQSGSGLAAVVRAVAESPERGIAQIRDFAPYAPAGDLPSAFVASAVYADSQLAGFVAVRFGADELTSIMTDDESWGALGDSGETYIVGSDDLMRSEARGFLEDRRTYLEAVSDARTASDSQIRSMEVLGTTVLFQPIDGDKVAAASDTRSVGESVNYLGVAVLSSGAPLAIEGVDWVVFADAEVGEIQQPIDDFVRNLLIVIAVFIVLLTFAAVQWADRLLEPLRIVSARLRAIRQGRHSSDEQALPDHSAKEFVELADDIDTMLATLRTRSAVAAQRKEERRSVLRRLLPAAVAERVEAGESDVVEQIQMATVAVIVVDGLGSLMRAGSPDDARYLLDRVVGDADDLAVEHGVERMRLTGNTYIAACGATRPHLDHAARAVAFVTELLEASADLEHAETINLRVGLDSGPISVGLTGGTKLVYDAWGTTVQGASDLALRAEADQVLVSRAVAAQLPSSHVLESVGDDGSCALGAVIRENEPTS